MSYTFHTYALTYSDAQAKCAEEGQTLAMPKSQLEWDNLLEARQEQNPQLSDVVWLGLDDIQEEGTWRYILPYKKTSQHIDMIIRTLTSVPCPPLQPNEPQ